MFAGKSNIYCLCKFTVMPYFVNCTSTGTRNGCPTANTNDTLAVVTCKSEPLGEGAATATHLDTHAAQVLKRLPNKSWTQSSWRASGSVGREWSGGREREILVQTRATRQPLGEHANTLESTSRCRSCQVNCVFSSAQESKHGVR